MRPAPARRIIESGNRHTREDVMKRILIATDGSSCAREAVELGVELAAEQEAEVVFVHVVPAVEALAYGAFAVSGAVAYEPTEADHAALEEAELVAAEAGLTARSVLLRGDTALEIVAYADSIDADLIVVG